LVGHRADATAVGEHVVGELGLRRPVVGRPVDADDERQAVVALEVMIRGALGGVLSGAAASAAVLVAGRDRIATAVTIAVRRNCRPAMLVLPIKTANFGFMFPWPRPANMG